MLDKRVEGGKHDIQYCIQQPHRATPGQLAQAIREALPTGECLYFGSPDAQALAAERLYVGFWTDKGSCDEDTRAFLEKLEGKDVFLFGTAGFGGAPEYFQRLLDRVRQALPGGNRVTGAFMCQGRMPASVRERYELHAANPRSTSFRRKR